MPAVVKAEMAWSRGLGFLRVVTKTSVALATKEVRTPRCVPHGTECTTSLEKMSLPQPLVHTR